MIVQVLISPTNKIDLEVKEKSGNLYSRISSMMINTYNFKADKVSNMKFILSALIGPRLVPSEEMLTEEEADSSMKQLFRDKEERGVQGVTVHWTIDKISVLPFGKGIKNLRNKTPLSENVEYNSRRGVMAVKRFLEGRIRVTAKDEREVKKQRTSTSATTKTSTDSQGFDIVMVNDDSYDILTDESDLAVWLEQDHWFVNFSQSSYSNLNEMVLRHFKYEFNNGMGHKEVSFSQVHNTLINNPAQSERLKKLCEEEANRLRETHPKFEELIADVVKELNQWSIILPRQFAYNEATRRLLINPVTRITSMLLGAQAIHIQAPQCTGLTAPKHFLGQGSVDYVLASGSTGIGASTVVQSALDPSPEDTDFDEDDPDERQQVVDGLAQALRNGVAEANILNNPAAFNQLCGECHDHAFVSSEEHAKIANHVALASSTGLGVTVVEECINRGNGASGAAKGSAASTIALERAHKCVTGILTTGQTWEVFTFTTESLAADEKPRVAFKGRLSMRVLTYQVKFNPKSAAKSDADLRGSGAAPPISVKAAEVANVVALLYLAGTNRLHDTIPLAPPASAPPASGQSAPAQSTSV